jgi:predicted Zn-dependent protease
MSWQRWADALRQAPRQAVADLLRGAADISPYERIAPHEFLLAVLPRGSRLVNQTLLGEPPTNSTETDMSADLPALVDAGLSDWLLAQREAALPPARKLGAYVTQVCEALQWPLYFALPQTRSVLQTERAQWLRWLGTLTLSAYRDPEYDYWQVLAAQQADDNLQFFWHSFVVEAGRTRSSRYLNLGLLALSRLPLSENDSLRNLRLQVQALVNRYQHRKARGAPAQEELAENLRSVMARNPSMSEGNYRAFLSALLAPLGEDKAASVLSFVGFGTAVQSYGAVSKSLYKLEPPGMTGETDEAVRAVRQSGSLAQAWKAIRPLLSAHEDFMHKSGDAYYFVRNLDRCGRALCDNYSLRDPEVRDHLFQWIHLSLRMDADNPRLWMLWELALRKAEQPQRAQWVLWEMTRRFPDQLPCRVELARLLAESDTPDDQVQAHRLLQQVLQQDADNLHAHNTLAQLAIHCKDWGQALSHAQQGLRIDTGNQASALLLAQAYAWRNEQDDMQTAIEHLQHFVTRYRGNVNTEGYLCVLLQRQQLAEQGQLAAFKEDEEPASMEAVPAETDPAWLAFAESLRSLGTASPSGNTSAGSSIGDADLVERVLPLPQALRQAVVQGLWGEDVLDRYEADAQQEFPLETRLWHYLKTLRTDSPSSERDRARQAVQAWLAAETQALGQDNQGNESWVNYRNKHWEALSASADTALATGAEWLKDLLDRYHPLPAPLLA